MLPCCVHLRVGMAMNRPRSGSRWGWREGKRRWGGRGTVRGASRPYATPKASQASPLVKFACLLTCAVCVYVCAAALYIKRPSRLIHAWVCVAALSTEALFSLFTPQVLRTHVMVRVGGGWDTLEHYLDKHDPCRCSAFGEVIFLFLISSPTNNLIVELDCCIIHFWIISK